MKQDYKWSISQWGEWWRFWMEGVWWILWGWQYGLVLTAHWQPFDVIGLPVDYFHNEEVYRWAQVGDRIDWYSMPCYLCADLSYDVDKWLHSIGFWDLQRENGSQDQNNLGSVGGWMYSIGLVEQNQLFGTQDKKWALGPKESQFNQKWYIWRNRVVNYGFRSFPWLSIWNQLM